MSVMAVRRHDGAAADAWLCLGFLDVCFHGPVPHRATTGEWCGAMGAQGGIHLCVPHMLNVHTYMYPASKASCPVRCICLRAKKVRIYTLRYKDLLPELLTPLMALHKPSRVRVPELPQRAGGG
jgi:hypothetical protein